MSTRPNPNPQSNGEEAEEIDVSLRILKTVSLKVSKCMTVGGVKALVYEKEGIPECMQEMFYNGNHLKNDSKMVDHGISTNSTLNAYVSNALPMNLTISILRTNKTVLVQARSKDTVQNIEALIEARENIPSYSHTLVHAGKLLEEDKTLAFLEIRGGATLHVVFIPQGMFQISVKLLNGEVVKMQVNMSYTILDVKELLESIVGSPVGVLTCDGNMLLDNATLSQHKISSDSMLEMVCQIFIKSGCKSTAFEVRLGDSVAHLKEMIGSRMGTPVHAQRLVFEGKMLEDERDLASYGVHKDSNIYQCG
ncbi:unnamed protein product [Cuscuta europaea]|uniref:Ubiquitin-like domain-containing protein n=1 Tax=Cuscuta europaea TaxID=41803 RepID=A0A9P0YR39_CUSEU|nr:unnamed protein product [Cuscuta europaea]